MKSFKYRDSRKMEFGPFKFTDYPYKGMGPEEAIKDWNKHSKSWGTEYWIVDDNPKLMQEGPDSRFKYGEGEIVDSIKEYIASTYGEHYAAGVKSVQAFDAVIAMDKEEAWRFFRNCAIKYLWRLGRKDGFNQKDLMKAAHYLVLVMAQTKDRK